METERKKIDFTAVDAVAITVGGFDGYRPSDLPDSYLMLGEKIVSGLSRLGFKIVKDEMP